MSARIKCNTCQNDFFVDQNTGSQSCPYCGSVDISEKSGGFSINTSFLKKMLIPGIILLAIVLIFLIIKMIGGDSGPKIIKVDSDKNNCRITVNAKASSQNRRMQYSFDNGKTYQNVRVFKVQEPGTYMVVVKDDKNKTVSWAVPQTFTREDIDKCGAVPPPPPIQITGVEYTDETIKDMNDGQIKIHTISGTKPVNYSINAGLNYVSDSIFNNLKPGKYVIQVEDGLSIIASWQDTITINPGINIVLPPGGGSKVDTSIVKPRLDKMAVESKLNMLFSDPDNKKLRDEVLGLFVNQTMPVDCELIGIPSGTPYQLFQFLERRFEGPPGSKEIKVLDIGYTPANKINKLKVKETKSISK